MKISKSFFALLITLLLSSQSEAFTLLSSSITSGWDTETLTFDVNETSCTALGITSSDLNEAIDLAVNLWNTVPTSKLKIAKGSIVTTTAHASNPVIYCSNTSQNDNIPGVGGIGATTGGHPSTGSLILNGDSTKNTYFNNLSVTFRAIVLAHEMGHVMGIGHSETSYALMYYDISTKENLNLAQDDVDALTWLNPRSDLSDGIMGCGTINDIGNQLPPPKGMGAVAFNWIFVILVAYIASKLRRPSYSLNSFR